MVRVSADSTCDLSPELIARHEIAIAPLYIIRGEESLRDGVEITAQDIFDYVDKTGKLCKTSAVSVEDYIALFKRLTAEGDQVVHITISADMSACYQNACIAAEEVPGVFPVDSRNLSTGIGHLVLEAARMAREGLDGAAIQAQLVRLAPCVESSFVIERLDYLRMGGRCSALTALGANLLHLKPCIEVRNGVMGVGKKYRGSFEKALCQYVYDRLHGRDDIARERAFITCSSCDAQLVAQVRALCEREGGFSEIYETRAGGTISNHCGPNTLGVLFLRKA